jgi:NADPH-dependent ferric siderophore reductase
VHDGGAASNWAGAAQVDAPAAISGPGRGYAVDADAHDYFVGGDETAIPAISQLLEELPTDARVHVAIEIADPRARLNLPAHPGASVQWHEASDGAPAGAALFDALRAADLAPTTKIWMAGEAAAVQRIRKHLFDERGIARRDAWIRGYWEHGRAGNADDE